MSEMVESVARAMALWVGYMGVLDTMPPGDPGDPRNEAWIEANFRPFLTTARATIEPMREPTTGMAEAFYRAYERPLSPDRWESRFSNAMEAMIDEALRERAEERNGEA